MNSNLQKLKKYMNLTCLETDIKNAQKEADTLREDIEFLSLYMKRNKETDFQLNIVPAKGICRKFFRDIYVRNYSFNLQDLDEMIIEYHVLKLAMEIASAKLSMRRDKEIIADMYTYFKRTYAMDIRDYVNDFINCSLSCKTAKENIDAVIEEFELEQETEQEERG